MQLKNPAEICTPAQLYLGMSLISTIGFSASSAHVLATIWHLFMNLVWTYFLSYLCDNGHTGISWFLILFPFLIILGIVFAFLHMKTNAQPTASKKGTTTTAANKSGATQAESMLGSTPVPFSSGM